MKPNTAIVAISLLALILLGALIFAAARSYRGRASTASIEYSQVRTKPAPLLEYEDPNPIDQESAERLALDEARAHRLKQQTPVAQVGAEVVFEGDITHFMLLDDNTLSREEVIDVLIRDSILLQAGFDERRITTLNANFFNTYEKNWDKRASMVQTVLDSLDAETIDPTQWIAEKKNTITISLYEN